MDDLLTARPVILVIGDQPLLRMQAVDLVEDAGFAVIEASGADEAVRALEACRDIRLVFTDIDLMDGQDGLHLTQAIRDRWPPVGMILVSDRHQPEQLPLHGEFFAKPYRSEEVMDAIRRLVA